MSVEDLADAVLHLRESAIQAAPLSASIDELRAGQESMNRHMDRLDGLSERMAQIEASVLSLTNGVQSVQYEIEDQGGAIDHLTRVQASVERLTRAVAEIREPVPAPTVAGPAIDALRDSIDNTTSIAMATRNELVEMLETQTRETNALRRQVTDLLHRMDERTAQPKDQPFDHETLIRQIESLRGQVAELHGGSDVVTATDLAATINTLRGAGIEDISAAHLVHTFQVDVRDLRREVSELKAELAQRLAPADS